MIGGHRVLPRVAVYGAFDVLDFGELLFPHLLRHGIGLAAHQMATFARRGGRVGWMDAIEPQPIDAAPAFAAALHVAALPRAVPAAGEVQPEGDPIWLEAGLIAARLGARLAWDAPGLSCDRDDDAGRRLRDMVLAACDYVSVREEDLAGFDGAPASVELAAVPDPLIDLSRLWPAPALRPNAVKAFAARGASVPERWVVFHVDALQFEGAAADHARDIQAICAGIDASAVLLALSLGRGDDALARTLGEHLGGRTLVVDRPEGLREIAGLIAHGAGYAGSSLQGAIAASSYRRPAIAVGALRTDRDRHRVEPFAMTARCVESWPDAAQSVGQALRPLGKGEAFAISRTQDLVAGHWERLRALVTRPQSAAAIAARGRLARWLTDCAPELRHKHAHHHVVGHEDAPIREERAVPSPATPCNICGGVELWPEPPPVPGQRGFGGVCKGCGSSARQRAMRVVVDALRHDAYTDRTCLVFGSDRIADPDWFAQWRHVPCDAAEDIDRATSGQADASVDVVICTDALERAREPRLAFTRLLQLVRPGGYLFVAFRTVPGREETVEYDSPRDGELREFGADVGDVLLNALPGAAVVAARPIDPVTGISTTVYLAAHEQSDLFRLLTRDVPCEVLQRPVERLGIISSARKPILLTFGSCQTQLVTDLVRLCPTIADNFECETLASYEAPGQITQIDFDRLDRTAIVWEEIVQGEPTEYRRLLRGAIPGASRTIRFPPLDLVSLWPHQGIDPRTGPELPRYVHGRFPFADAVGAKLAGVDASDAELLARYMELSRKTMPDLDRLWAVDEYRLRARDALSDVKIADWVIDSLKTTRLVYAMDHLTGAPVVHITKLLVAATPELAAQSEKIAREIDTAVTEMGFDGHDQEHVPIHPDVAAHFGLAWHKPDMKYRWDEHWWTHDEYIVKYIRWTDWAADPPIARAAE